ncbi:sensor histidine kinase [Campylobacterota bacterium DY0563]
MIKIKFSQKFFSNLKKYKIYHIIVLFTVSYLLMLANSFYNIHRDIKNLAEKNRILISKDIEYSIYSWLEERINNIETSSNYFKYNDVYKNEIHLQNLLNILLNNNLYFDTVQALIKDYYFYGDKRKYHDYREEKTFISPYKNIEPTKTKWYLDTKKYLKTTITTMESHGELHKKTINICTPLTSGKKFEGVLCGVIKTDSIFKKIKKLKFANNTYFFICDKNGKLLTKIEDKKVEKTIEKQFSKIIKPSDKVQEIKIGDNSITVERFKHFDWYIGVGMKQNEINKLGFSQLVENVAFLSVCFIILLILINASHEFLRRRVEKAEKEYEYILSHRSRMQEVGELISGINHQLQQPLNSLTLLLTATKSKLKDKSLDMQTLENNLTMSVKSIQLMATTIASFRNFYRCSENINEFFLSQSIKSVLQVLHVSLAKKNITVEFDEKSIINLKVNSVENFVQQILLVLLQNSKDAVSNKLIKKRVIKIEVKNNNDIVEIKIKDWGEGVNKNEIDKLFTNKKGESKKSLGSGIGLYFAKKITQKKLGGELFLENPCNPTIFTFTFKKNL